MRHQHEKYDGRVERQGLGSISAALHRCPSLKRSGEETISATVSLFYLLAESIAALAVDPRNPRRVPALPQVCKSAGRKNAKQ
jgi:hypothetical protein